MLEQSLIVYKSFFLDDLEKGSKKRKRRETNDLKKVGFQYPNFKPKSLCVDFVGDNIFFINEEMGKEGIYIATMDGKFSRLLIRKAIAPTALAINPETG